MPYLSLTDSDVPEGARLTNQKPRCKRAHGLPHAGNVLPFHLAYLENHGELAICHRHIYTVAKSKQSKYIICIMHFKIFSIAIGNLWDPF